MMEAKYRLNFDLQCPCNYKRRKWILKGFVFVKTSFKTILLQKMPLDLEACMKQHSEDDLKETGNNKILYT